MSTYSGLKIDGRRLPPFVIVERTLMFLNPERSYIEEQDNPVDLGLLEGHPEVAMITAIDGRRTTDGSLKLEKYWCFSRCDEKDIVTAYLAYTFNGPIIVRDWKNELSDLGRVESDLGRVDFEHVNIYPSRSSEKVVERHLERIRGRTGLVEGLMDLAEQRYFDMLWNVPQF